MEVSLPFLFIGFYAKSPVYFIGMVICTKPQSDLLKLYEIWMKVFQIYLYNAIIVKKCGGSDGGDYFFKT